MRVAAIGVNHWHSLYDMAYLHQLRGMPGVTLVGVHDEDPAIASHRAAAVGEGIPAFTSYPDMLDEVEPDLVLVLDRHDRMGEIVDDLLERHMPLIVEKPGAFSARQLRPLAEKARRGDVFAAVPLFQRYSPFMQHAIRLVSDGAVGAMRHFYARLNRPTSARYPGWGSGWMLDPVLSNGGCLRNLGIHGLDCFVYLSGEEEGIEVTAAQLSWNTHNEAVEDYASVLLKSARGVVGTIEVGNVFPSEGRDLEMKVDFDAGILRLEAGTVRLYTTEGVETLPTPPPDPPVLARWVAARINGGDPPAGIRDCYLAVRLVDLAYLAAGNPYGTAAI